MKHTVHIKTAEALDEAQAIKKTYDRAMKAQQDLRDELQRRADALSEAFQLELLTHWRALHRLLDLPEADVGKWGLDARYLEDHGFAFLEKREKCVCGMDHDELPDLDGLLAHFQAGSNGIKH